MFNRWIIIDLSIDIRHFIYEFHRNELCSKQKKNRNKRNRTCITMCASWVLGKSRHSCFSSIKKLLWFIGVENCRYRCHQSPINFNMGWSHICVFHFMWKYMKWLHDDCFQQRIITLGDGERERERECDRTKNAIFSHC